MALSAILALSACESSGCEKYASSYGCEYVEEEAEYWVYYWRDLDRDDEADNTYIGQAVGLRMCEENARAFAAAIKESFVDRAYICLLMDAGRAKEKHRIQPR